MKNLNRLTLHIVQILFLSFIIVSCNKEDISDSFSDTNSLEENYGFEEVSNKNLPEKVEGQISMVRENLNKYMEGTLQLVDVNILGQAQSKSINVVLEAISDENFVVAYGNIMEPESVHIGSMSNLIPAKVNEGKNLLKQHASDQIEEGDIGMEILWNYKGQPIKTLAFYNNDGISWDNLMVGLIMMDPVPQIKEHEEISIKSGQRVLSKTRGNTWHGNWLWGQRRGTISYSITIRYEGSNVVNTTITDSGWMNIGSAKSESKVTRRTGRFGEGKYALGLCTPIASLKFNRNDFEVSVSGIGSSIIRNGTRDVWP